VLNILGPTTVIIHSTAGDRSTELGQVSISHAVLTSEHLNAQSKSYAVSDVGPVLRVTYTLEFRSKV